MLPVCVNVFRPKLDFGFMCAKINNKFSFVYESSHSSTGYGRQLILATLTYKNIPMLGGQYWSTIKIYCFRYFHDTQPQLRSDLQRTTNVSMRLAFGL